MERRGRIQIKLGILKSSTIQQSSIASDRAAASIPQNLIGPLPLT